MENKKIKKQIKELVTFKAIKVNSGKAKYSFHAQDGKEVIINDKRHLPESIKSFLR